MNIGYVLKRDLCTGCGVCYSVCSKSCINMKVDQFGYIRPSINNKECINCGKCLKVCSGFEWSNDIVNKFYFNEKPSNLNIGVYKKCYIGYSADKNIRFNSASGGIVTSVLVYLLEKKLVDAVIVTIMDNNNKTFGKMIIAETIEEVLNSAKSKYTPVHIGDVLKKVQAQDRKFALVGLPCHIQSLRKAQIIDKKLFDKIPYCIGILCGGGVSNIPTQLEIEKSGIPVGKIKEFKYRMNGWSKFKVGIETKDGNKRLKNYMDTYFGLLFNNHITSPKRCQLCYDLFAESADISCGDAWLKEYAGNEQGYSILICRNNKTLNLISNIEKEGKIQLIEANTQKIEESQIGQIIYKKKKIFTRMLFYRGIPKYDFKEREKVNLRYLFAYALFKVADNSVKRAVAKNKLNKKNELYFKIIKKLTSYQFY